MAPGLRNSIGSSHQVIGCEQNRIKSPWHVANVSFVWDAVTAERIKLNSSGTAGSKSQNARSISMKNKVAGIMSQSVLGH